MWVKKGASMGRFRLHIEQCLVHKPLHKLRGTTKPRASRRRSHQTLCDFQCASRGAATASRRTSPSDQHRRADGEVEHAEPPLGSPREVDAVSQRSHSSHADEPTFFVGCSDGRHLGFRFPASFRDGVWQAALRRAQLTLSVFGQQIPRRRSTAPSFDPPFQAASNICWRHEVSGPPPAGVNPPGRAVV